MVEFCDLVADEFTDLRRDAVWGQLQPCFSFWAIAYHRGACVAGDFEHRYVFAQDMDKETFATSVAGMEYGLLEKASPIVPATGMFDHRDTELGSRWCFGSGWCRQ